MTTTTENLKKLQKALADAKEAKKKPLSKSPELEILDQYDGSSASLCREVADVKKRQKNIEDKLDSILAILTNREQKISEFLSDNRLLYVSNLNAILERGISTETALNKMIDEKTKLTPILQEINRTQQNISILLAKLSK